MRHRSNKLTRGLCVFLTLSLNYWVGCGQSVSPNPDEGIMIPLTPDHPVKKALAGSMFADATSIVLFPATQSFKLVFPDADRHMSGNLSVNGDGLEMSQFDFARNGDSVSFKINPATGQVIHLTASNGLSWQPTRILTAAPDAKTKDAYLSANSELIQFESKQLQESGSGGSDNGQTTGGGTTGIPSGKTSNGFFIAWAIIAGILYGSAVFAVIIFILELIALLLLAMNFATGGGNNSDIPSGNPVPPDDGGTGSGAGACCINGTCATGVTAGACSDQGGVYQGDQTTGCQNCGSGAGTTGSCCAANGGCTVTTQASCSGTWSAGGTCDPNPCQQPPTGACCTNGDCSVTTQANCRGTWTSGGNCVPNNCSSASTGACCIGGRTCVPDLTQAACQQLDGVYQGDNSVTCENCSVSITGSCCEKGGCSVTTEANCNGTWTSGGNCPQGLFTDCPDVVDFADVVAGTYPDGTQYDALGGDDIVHLPLNDTAATLAGYAFTQNVETQCGSQFSSHPFDGGPGDDRIFGGDMNDTINGGDGDDTIYGSNGCDILDGGPGVNTLSYENYNGIVTVLLDAHIATKQFGGVDQLANFQNVIGSPFDDQITGDDQGNVLNGGGGNDTLRGKTAADTLIGGEGDDFLFGEEGNDTLDGGPGNDSLIGGPGDDLMTGGPGVDSFYFQIVGNVGEGNDRITDYELNTDGLHFFGLANAAALDAVTTWADTNGGADLKITFTGGGSITLNHLGGLNITNTTTFVAAGGKLFFP